MQSLPPEYNLNRTDLLKMLPSMVGLPVTHEHMSIHNAVTHLPNNHALAPANVIAAMTAVGGDTFGRVISAFEGTDGHFRVQMYVPLEHSPNLAWLITDKILGSVSLTHVVEAGVPVPLEVSLVGTPARPGSVIEHTDHRAIESAKYKGRLTGRIIYSMDTTTIHEKAPTSTFANAADVIAALPPQQRELIVAKLTSLVAHRDNAVARETAAKAAAHTAETALAAKTTAGTADQMLMAEQMRLLYANMKRMAGPDIDLLEHYCLNQEDVATDTKKLLDTEGGSHRVLQTIMCCNQAMMMNNLAHAQAAIPPANKRARTSEAESVPLAIIPENHAIAAPAESNTSLLARALAENFGE